MSKRPAPVININVQPERPLPVEKKTETTIRYAKRMKIPIEIHPYITDKTSFGGLPKSIPGKKLQELILALEKQRQEKQNHEKRKDK